MRFRPVRTDRLLPKEREIVDQFERGVIDAAEAGRLLLASVESVGPDAPASVDESEVGAEEKDGVADEISDEAKARALVERVAREAYDDPP